MRVIAGVARSMPLKTPEGLDTRPTTDRIKETLFNMLQNDVPGAVFVDLFSGSGAIGIEALSRGAAFVDFFDKDRNAAAIIKDNLEHARMLEQAKVHVGQVEKLVPTCKGGYNLVFLDPPYKSNFYTKALDLIDKYHILSEQGIVICEHAREDSLPNEIGSLAVSDTRKIGTVQFTFYTRR